MFIFICSLLSFHVCLPTLLHHFRTCAFWYSLRPSVRIWHGYDRGIRITLFVLPLCLTRFIITPRYTTLSLAVRLLPVCDLIAGSCYVIIIFKKNKIEKKRKKKLKKSKRKKKKKKENKAVGRNDQYVSVCFVFIRLILWLCV